MFAQRLVEYHRKARRTGAPRQFGRGKGRNQDRRPAPPAAAEPGEQIDAIFVVQPVIGHQTIGRTGGRRSERLWHCRIGRHIEPAPVEQEEERTRSEEHTSELQSLMRISYAVFCLKKTNNEQTYK